MSVEAWIELIAITITVLGACGAFLWWAACTHKDVKRIPEIETKLDRLSISVAEILGIVKSKPDMKAVQSTSPVQLTAYGEALFSDVNGKQIVRNHIDKVQIQENMNEYEIQEACIHFAFSSLMNELSEDEKKGVQSVAFTEGIAIETILNVLGVSFRNALFDIKNLSIHEIDKYEKDSQT